MEADGSGGVPHALYKNCKWRDSTGQDHDKDHDDVKIMMMVARVGSKAYNV